MLSNLTPIADQIKIIDYWFQLLEEAILTMTNLL